MAWYLLLAHLIADYPLQPGWIVRNKTHFWVLFLHASIHFVTMVLITLPVSTQLWPYLLALAFIHFCIDSGKNWFTLHRPQWRAWLYVVDQACHVISIGLVSAWMAASAPGIQPLLPKTAAGIATGFLLVTYVFVISERVLSGNQTSSLTGSQAQVITRLFARAALLSLLLVGWKIHAITAANLALVMPYPGNRTGLRILFIDVSVTLLTALLVVIIIGS